MNRSLLRRCVAILAGCAWVIAVGCDSGAGSVSPSKPQSVASDAPRNLDELQELADAKRSDEGISVRDTAFELLEAGQTLEAEQLLLQYGDEAKRRFGATSLEFAWTQFDLSSVYVRLGQMPKAITALRKACDVDATGSEQAQKDRLTFLMNLGEFLTYDGQLDEAHDVLEINLREREVFYGRDHPGYAYGLEPLASVSLRQGDLEQALILSEEAVSNYRENGHPQLVMAMALRAEVLKTRSLDAAAFPGCAVLTDELMLDLVDSVIYRVSADNAELGQALFSELHPLVRDRFGPHHPKTISVLSGLAGTQRLLSNHAEREPTLRQILDAHEAQGEEMLAIEVMKAIAIAQSDAGKNEAAERTYLEALQRSRKVRQPTAESDVLRNYGLFLAEIDRTDDAKKNLEAALERAESTSDARLVGISQVSLGIFCQHHQELDRAKNLLTDGYQALDPLSTDALCAKSHLTAIEQKADCGCNAETMAAAISSAVRAYMIERLPEGLLEEVIVSNGAAGIQIKTAREPTPEEAELLQQVTEHALTHFRQQVRLGPTSPIYQQLQQ